MTTTEHDQAAPAVPTIYGCPYSPNCAWRVEVLPTEAPAELDRHRASWHPLGYDDPTPWQDRPGMVGPPEPDAPRTFEVPVIVNVTVTVHGDTFTIGGACVDGDETAPWAYSGPNAAWETDTEEWHENVRAWDPGDDDDKAAADAVAAAWEQRFSVGPEAAALDAIAAQLTGREWTASDIEDVADKVRATGRTIAGPDEDGDA